MSRDLELVERGVHRMITMRFGLPHFDTEAGCWKCVLDCESLDLKKRAICGEDAIQALLLALVLAKEMCRSKSDSENKIYWLSEGDECGLSAIVTK
jgi:hypothetical protein